MNETSTDTIRADRRLPDVTVYSFVTLNADFPTCISRGGSNFPTARRPGTRGAAGSHCQQAVMEVINTLTAGFGFCCEYVLQNVIHKPDCSSAFVRHQCGALYLHPAAAVVQVNVQFMLNTASIEQEL